MITPLSKPLMLCDKHELMCALGRKLCEDYCWRAEFLSDSGQMDKIDVLIGALMAYLPDELAHMLDDLFASARYASAIIANGQKVTKMEKKTNGEEIEVKF